MPTRLIPFSNTWKIIVTILMLALLTAGFSTWYSSTQTQVASAATLCGNGSAPDYGFSYSLQQLHWTVNWQGYASQQAVNEVDEILDQLEGDAIAQTMILILSPAEVGNRVNCAVHFLRYMKLGLPDGERKDNGFVFLIVVEPNRIDVHYGVGLGLPALTAHELTSLNRLAEQTYDSTKNIDHALLALVRGFDEYARSKYTPYAIPTTTPIPIELPALPTGALGITTLCCLMCIGTLIVLFIIWVLVQAVRRGITFTPSPYSRPSRSYRSPRTSFPSSRSSPRMRGGSGSGRSGRGN